MNKFVKRQLKKFAMLLLAYVVCSNVNAQICLHEAADITQTKATLSADFVGCEGLSSRYFMYKVGAFPEIDDFSKLALDSLSERFQLTSTGRAWTARTVKGWVESNKDLSVGQQSVMSAEVTIYQSTFVSFEWSVDSEENYGLLSFVVDGTVVKEISGYVDFTEVTHFLDTGVHTLQWIYSKKSATNVGLDLGMVRNIEVHNTTPGIWKSTLCDDSSVRLVNLQPGKDYLFKAAAGNLQVGGKVDSIIIGSVRRSASEERVDSKMTPIKTFSTKPVSIGEVAVDTTTQTTAIISSPIDLGDAEATATINISRVNSWPEWSSNNLFQAGFLKESYPCEIVSSTNCSPSTFKEYISCIYATFTVEVDLPDSATLSFDWRVSSSTGKLFIDDEFITDTREMDWVAYSCGLSAGRHTVSWSQPASYGYLYLKNINIQCHTSKTITHTSPATVISGLLPSQSYQGELLVVNDKAPYDTLYHSEPLEFTTLPPTVKADSCVDLMQASVTIQGYVDGGDAKVIAVGLQHKDTSGKRWTDYPLNTQDKALAYRVTRLKPNTSYHYRSYIHVEGCDTLFSTVADFTTTAVTPLEPTITKLTQNTAVVQGCIDSGDASVYQRGMQFRKKGDAEWETHEDGGDAPAFSLTKNNLKRGTQYEARTYVQPAGGEIIYSDILLFMTKNTYFSKVWSANTLTSVTFFADFCERDEEVVIEECGFRYSTLKNDYSDYVSVPVGLDSVISITINDLTSSDYVQCTPYVKINGEYIYHNAPGYAGTRLVSICTSISDITTTTAVLKLDSIPQSEFSVTEIEYAIYEGDWCENPDTLRYHKLEKENLLSNLTPGCYYRIYYRGLVNGIPYRLDVGQYSRNGFMTIPVTAEQTYLETTQTTATIKLRLINADDADVSDFRFVYRRTDASEPLIEGVFDGATLVLTGLTPDAHYSLNIYASVNGWRRSLGSMSFKTMIVRIYEPSSRSYQTSADIFWGSIIGDATCISSGVQYGTSFSSLDMQVEGLDSVRLKDLQPSTRYYYRVYFETEECGLMSYSGVLETSAIVCETLSASSLSNRSATLNGVIDCDAYSSAEFGFIWKQMNGWVSEPAFTKGVKNDNDSISVALVNGMLEPNTDYQYQAAVHYKGTIYSGGEWKTFRTESEFVYYPATVYTVYRTDRENNCLVLCGYFVAGSEEVVSQGYEYWANSNVRTAGNVHRVTTDETMLHTIDISTFNNGAYTVRAFVTTASGETIYGQALSFRVINGEVSGIDNVKQDEEISVFGYYDLNGRKLSEMRKGVNIVVYSNGERRKVFVK